MTPQGRMLFPRSLVEDTLAIAARRFPLYAQDPQFDMEPWGKNVYYGTAGAAVQIIDPVTGAYRESTAQDCFDIARLVEDAAWHAEQIAGVSVDPWIGLAQARALDLPFITEVVLAEVASLLQGHPQQGTPFFDNSGQVPTFRRL